MTFNVGKINVFFKCFKNYILKHQDVNYDDKLMATNESN